MKKDFIKKFAVGALALGTVFSASGLSPVTADAAAKVGGKVAVTPYIQYTFDSADTMYQNSGTSASDSSKDYTLRYNGNSTPENMCYLNDVELKDNGFLYLEGENNPFANGDLNDFTLTMDVTASYSSWYGSPVSWDGIVGDADNDKANNGNWAAHKYMRVTSAASSSDGDWLRFTDSQASNLNSAHWESYWKGTSIYKGERTSSTSPRITLIISVDKDSQINVMAYMGVNKVGSVTKSLSGINWNLYEADALYKYFSLGAAYDSRDGQHTQMKFKGRMDNVRIYDFAMTEAQMLGYGESEERHLFVDGVEVDGEIVGGSVTVDKQVPAIGETVTITPVADTNSELVSVTVNGEKIQPVGGVYQATMVEGGLFVSAEFVRSFAVTVDDSVVNGAIVADKTIAKEGELVTFTVTPDAGYGVKKVTMNGATVEAVDGVYSYVMPSEEMVISAEFAKKIAISVKDGIENGTVTVNKTECWAGESVIVNVKAAEGYEVKKVLVNGVEIEKSGIVYKFTATEDCVVEAKFGKIGEDEGFSLTALLGCNGSVAGGGLTAVVGAVALALLKKKRK